MPDALGWRLKLGVIAPSTNTVVQPEFDMMRPPGVTNHFGRIHIPNDPLRGDDDFTRLIDTVRREMMAAIDRVMTCEPDHLVMGMSSETFWDGLDGSERLRERVEERAGVKVAMGSDAAGERHGRPDRRLRRAAGPGLAGSGRQSEHPNEFLAGEREQDRNGLN